MSQIENSNDSRKQWWEERRERAMKRRGPNSHIWTGLFLVLIGVGAIIKISIIDLPYWVFNWQMILILLGIFLGIRDKFRGGAWFVLILVGSAFLVSEIIPDLSLRKYIWPMVAIVVGFLFILKPKKGRWSHDIAEKKMAM